MSLMRSALVTGTVAAATALLGASAPAPASAAPVAPVTAASFTSAPKPWITGSLTPGQVITANTGTWSPAPSRLTYTFYKFASNGYRITLQSGTSNRYYVKNSDNTYRIQVEVRAERSGYTTTSRTSNTTLHVLIPAQRSLVSRFGGDWHDMYFTGVATFGGPKKVVLPRRPTHAYVELHCTKTPSGAGADLYSERALTDTTVRPATGTGQGGDSWASAMWLDYPTEGHLGYVNVFCKGGDWSLIVRPAASAPPVYSSASGQGGRAFVYTGPVDAQRVFTAAPSSTTKWWINFHFGETWDKGASAYLANDKDSGATTFTGYPPAGPMFLQIASDGVNSWSMS